MKVPKKPPQMQKQISQLKQSAGRTLSQQPGNTKTNFTQNTESVKSASKLLSAKQDYEKKVGGSAYKSKPVGQPSKEDLVVSVGNLLTANDKGRKQEPQYVTGTLANQSNPLQKDIDVMRSYTQNSAVVFDPRTDSRAQSQLAAQRNAVQRQQGQVRAMQAQVPGRAGGGISGQMGAYRGPSPTAKPTNQRGTNVEPLGQGGRGGVRYDSPSVAVNPKYAGGSLAAQGEVGFTPSRTGGEFAVGSPRQVPSITRQQAQSFANQMATPRAGTGGVKPTREMAQAISHYGIKGVPQTGGSTATGGPKTGSGAVTAGIMPPPTGSTPAFEKSLEDWKKTNGGGGGMSGDYGKFLNLPEGSRVPKDFRDSDRDGVDDRYQTGPGQPSGGGKVKPDAGSGSGGSRAEITSGNPLAGVRGPRTYMGTEDKPQFGARSTAELERVRATTPGPRRTHEQRWRKAAGLQE